MRSSNCFLAAASLFHWAKASLPHSKNSLDESNGRWIYDIPPAEAAALAAIVEEEPADSPHLEGRDTNKPSPQYDLIYQVELPIPPVKEPSM